MAEYWKERKGWKRGSEQRKEAKDRKKKVYFVPLITYTYTSSSSLSFSDPITLQTCPS
jgi:hypothetical protein